MNWIFFSVTLVLVCLANPGAQAQRVLVIAVDGLRPDAMEAANTPFIDALIANGTYSRNSTTSDLTFSGPAHTDILSGVHRNDHGATTNDTSDNPAEIDPQFQIYSGSQQHNFPDFLAIANTANPTFQTARFTGGWDPIHTTRSPAGSEYTFKGNDVQAAANAASYYSNNSNHAEVGYLYLNNPDAAGHSNGFNPTVAAYQNEIAATDTRFGSVISAIQGRTNFASEDWVFILVSDHGGDLGGGHSGNKPWQREVPFIVSGNSVQNGALGYGAKNVDVAATALTHLGVALPSSLVGHAIGLNGIADPRPTIGFGNNLIFNGDAEYDEGFTDHALDQALTGWEEFSDANFITETSLRSGAQSATILNYGTPGGFPLTTDPGPSARGDNFFSAGVGSSTSQSVQRIDVSSVGTFIDGNFVDYELAAYLGGFSSQNDKADFIARFLAADGVTVLETISLLGPDAAGRSNITGLFFSESTGDLTAGTRFVEFELLTFGNDGYADNLSFVLNLNFFLLGDANGDGAFDNSDIAPFVLALTNAAGYAAAYPGVDPDLVLDMNNDGVLNNFDILGFVSALTGG